MPAPKAPEGAPKTGPPAVKADSGRKPWKKKTHVDVVLEQADKLRQEIAEEETALNFELIDVKSITNYMGGESKVGIVFLDACRDNPFARSLARSLGANRSASVSQGLAPMSSEGGGLEFVYATSPGDVAADGEGTHSPFTAALLRFLPTKGVELDLVLKRVKADVIAATKNQQRPWTNSDLSTEVYLQPSN